MNNKTLSLTVAASSLIAASAIADYTGLTCASVDNGDGTWTARIYVNFDAATDRVVAVFGDSQDHLLITSTNGFYQNSFGGPTSMSINPAFYDLFPSLLLDSWVTICNDPTNGIFDVGILDIGIDWTDFGNGGDIYTDNGSWFVTPVDPLLLSPCEYQVLIGLFTMFELESHVSGVLNLQGIVGDFETFQARGQEFDFFIGPHTWTVDDDGKADFDNIQAAVDASSDGDEIVVMPGTYTGTGDQVVDMKGKAVRLHSNGVLLRPIIDGEGVRRGIVCDSGETSKTIIEGFTVTNGESTGGGGMWNDGSSPTLTDCTFTDNTAGLGGGMGNSSSNPTLDGCTFTGNTADIDGGGMYNVQSSPTLTNCTFENNTANVNGGGMRNSGSSSPTLDGCTFTNNNAGKGGGMANWSNSNPTLTNCTFEGNSADNANSQGGGMCNYESSPTLTDCTFTGNSAYEGGGMYSRDSRNSILDRCTFANNTSSSTGGGMQNDNSNPIVANCTFTSNTSRYGGGMSNHLESSPMLEDCTFTGNIAMEAASWGGVGGGMYNSTSSPTLVNCTFSDNTASSEGGGIYNIVSSPTLTDTTVCGNTPDQINGDWTDNGGNTIADVCPVDCPADVNEDGVVDVNDILALVGAWGSSGPLGDINDDGTVNVVDLIMMLKSWGPCE